MTGGDHGLGAFVAGARIVVVLNPVVATAPVAQLPVPATDADKTKEESFSFETCVAEIIYRKDNAEILSQTIKEELTNGLQRLSTEPLNISFADLAL